MDTQRIFGKAFKKPASKRSKAEKKYAGRTTKRRVALLDGIGLFFFNTLLHYTH